MLLEGTVDQEGLAELLLPRMKQVILVMVEILTSRIGGNGANGIVIIRYLGNPIATGGTIHKVGIPSTPLSVGSSNLIVSSGGTSTSTTSIDEGVSIGTKCGSFNCDRFRHNQSNFQSGFRKRY